MVDHNTVPHRFDGRVALVTGAARRRGIGRATALRLAREGADVACLDIARADAYGSGHGTAGDDELLEVVAEIEAMGRRAVAVRADISDGAQVEAAVEEATAALGTVELLANVAGGSGIGFGIGPLVGLPEAEFRRVVDVNLTGTFLMSQAVARRLVAAGKPGSIASVSSQAGKRAFPMLGAYCAAKAGVILLTQCLATELGPAGITVNAVCPGTVDTNLINPGGALSGMMDDKWLAANIPLARMQTAEDVASILCYLLSPDGSYITGEAVNSSGGQTMV